MARGERAIWQRRFWEHLIRDDEDFRRDVEYCYINPVKHRLVDRVCDWPYSSFHRDVRANLIPPDWGGDLEPGINSFNAFKAAVKVAGLLLVGGGMLIAVFLGI